MTDDLKNKPYLTTKEAAQYIGGDVTFRTIIRWIHDGLLPAYRNPSVRGHFKVRPSDLDTMLAANVKENQS